MADQATRRRPTATKRTGCPGIAAAAMPDHHSHGGPEMAGTGQQDGRSGRRRRALRLLNWDATEAKEAQMPNQFQSTQQRTVRYARSGDLAIAYEVVGDGPLDVVVVPGFASHLDTAWDEPGLAEFQRLLGERARLILYDRRGQGLSDRTVTAPTIEQNVADLRVVLDAVGSRRTALLAVSQGGPSAIAFAAAEPARTAALVLYGTYARASAADDYPVGPSPDQFGAFAERAAEGWGSDEATAWFAPSRC